MIQWFNKKMSKKRKGFTLIELIVVIAILGILAAIAIPRFSGLRVSTAVKADGATARSIISAARVYESETGDIVTDVATLSPALISAANLIPETGDGTTNFAITGGGTVDYEVTFTPVVAYYPYNVTQTVTENDGAWEADDSGTK